MVAYDYSRPKATADRLLGRFGQSGTLRRPTAASGPAHDPTPGPPVDHPVTFAVIAFSDFEVSGGRVLATDKKVLLAVGALAVTPTPSDKLVIGGVEHSIVGPDEGRGIKPIAPAGVVVVYELQVRR